MMKRFFVIAAMALALFSLYSCTESGDDELMDHTMSDGDKDDTTDPKPDPDIAFDGEFELGDLSESTFPDYNVWKITNSTIASSDAEALKSALGGAQSEGRDVELSFASLSATPSVLSAAEGLFYNCIALTTVDMPVVSSIGDYTFASCLSLKSLSLATDGMSKIESIASGAFDGTITTQIALTIGSANVGYVDGNTLTIPNSTTKANGSSWEFESITIVYGDVVDADSYNYLADFSANSFPLKNDTLVINDTYPQLEEFDGLKAAMKRIGTSRKIVLKFPALIALPSADVRSNGAFSGCNAASIDLPRLKSIGRYAFSECDKILEGVMLTYKENTKMEFMDEFSFGDDRVLGFKIYIGDANFLLLTSANGLKFSHDGCQYSWTFEKVGLIPSYNPDNRVRMSVFP